MSESFAECTLLDSIIIPESVTSILSAAFANCYSLKSVVLPSSLTEIQSQVFHGCAELTEINFPATITSIGYGSFSGTGFENIEIPCTVTNIYERAFLNCIRLKTVKIHSILNNLGNFAFRDCPYLQEILFTKDTPVIIGSEVFTNAKFNEFKVKYSKLNSGFTSPLWNGYPCEYLNAYPPVANAGPDQIKRAFNQVILDGSMSSDPDYNPLQFHWTAPAGIVLSSDTVFNPTFTAPNSQDTTSYVFSLMVNDGIHNSQIDTVVITVTPVAPESDFIFNSATGTILGYVGSGGDVIIPEKILGKEVLAIGDDAFLNCSALTKIELPSKVASIGNNAFMRCGNLKHIFIPDGVISVGSRAFLECLSLKEINLPPNIVSIGYECFQFCRSLKNIQIPN